MPPTSENSGATPAPVAFAAIICTGGPESPESRQNWALARALAERGHRIVVVCDGCRHDLVGRRQGVFEAASYLDMMASLTEQFARRAEDASPILEPYLIHLADAMRSWTAVLA